MEPLGPDPELKEPTAPPVRVTVGGAGEPGVGLKLTARRARFVVAPAVQLMTTDDAPASAEPAPRRPLTPPVAVFHHEPCPAPAVYEVVVFWP
jgi:hypothetical protein